MLEPKAVDVNGREYLVQPFNASEALKYLHGMIVARATGRGLAELGKIALDHCATPMLESLSKPLVFDRHFNQYPQDMLELESKAMDILCAPWESSASDEDNRQG